VITRPNTVVSTFREWFRLIGMRQRGLNVGLPHSPALCRSLSVQCSSIFHGGALVAFMLFNSGVQAGKLFCVITVTKISIHTFYDLRCYFIITLLIRHKWGRDSSVGIATRYGLDGPGTESRWGRDFPHPYRPALGPTQPPI
jgi:hypothetical protein